MNSLFRGSSWATPWGYFCSLELTLVGQYEYVTYILCVQGVKLTAMYMIIINCQVTADQTGLNTSSMTVNTAAERARNVAE